MLYKNLIDEFVSVAKDIFGKQLTGIYLHGSLAMGCFNPEKSDIDLIIIIENDISNTQKMLFMKQVVRLNSQAPQKGLEISVVKREYCNPFTYPTPFELHFSPMHLQWFNDNPENYIENMKGMDADLAAHFTIINNYGIVLWGEEIEKVFAVVPQKDYIDSICSDIENAAEDILDDPIYVILNLSRILAFLQDELYLSKEGGGKWGIEHLPLKYSSIISEALECYKTNKNMTIDKNNAIMFADEIMCLIKNKSDKYIGNTTLFRGDCAEKIYWDNPYDEPTAVFITSEEKCDKPVKLLEAGTKVYSMGEQENDEKYERLKKYDIHFIFTDNIPAPDFYSVPISYVFATDSLGGLYATAGGIVDIEESTPVCYISQDKNVYYIANSLKEFFANPVECKSKKYLTDMLKLYKSLDEAKKENTFIDVELPNHDIADDMIRK